ncbi:MAG TPA: glycosyltransferase, partial [Opitutaceae bacterium]|nr:glycosyltransferase [Opitutaceae bacterium]
MPALSALMVFHRDTPHLRSAVESVLNQTWRDLELVLVDNGTGLTADALGGAGRDPRLRWVRLARNEGIPSGHNAGLAVAAGEFIALLDYDDMAQPQRFERQIALLRSEPAVGLVSSLVDTIDETGTVVGREFSIVSGEAQRTYSAFAAPVVTPAYLGRRSVFARFPFRPEFSLAADFDFLARAAEVCEFAAVPEVLLHYRRYSGQTSESRKDVMEANWCAIRVATARRRRG